MIIPAIAFSSSTLKTLAFEDVPGLQEAGSQSVTAFLSKHQVAGLCYARAVSDKGAGFGPEVHRVTERFHCLLSLRAEGGAGGEERLGEDAEACLNKGAVLLGVDGFGTPLEWLQRFPKERLVIEFDLEQGASLAPVAEAAKAKAAAVAGLVVHFRGASQLNLDQIEALKAQLPRGLSLAVSGGIRAPEDVAKLDKLGVNALSSAALTAGVLDLGQAIAAPLVSDRSDGMFPTVVTDEQGVTLGLVYSSTESISKAVQAGRGVYMSRKHGLWFKGETSGSTQDLIRIDVDCDRDALKFVVHQNGSGFCHLNTWTCFGHSSGLVGLMQTLQSRKASAPEGSYTDRLFKDPALLRAKLVEEAEELSAAEGPSHVAAEVADVIYFALVKAVSAGVTLEDVERVLDYRALKTTRRPGDAKPGKLDEAAQALKKQKVAHPEPQPQPPAQIKMQCFKDSEIDENQRKALLLRPLIQSGDITSRIQPIRDAVLARGDAALLELTEKFDRVKLSAPVIHLPLKHSPKIDPKVAQAIDLAMDNVRKFHEAQVTATLEVETVPGITCSRFARPVERVGLYIPGGSAVLPSTAYMLGVPAKVAGCKEIVFASPPRKDGSVCPEVLYVAEKLGVKKVVVAGGAQAIFAMAYGTESVPKVDKICGPGNQYVTAAKMMVQNDSTCMVSIDMPAGPSELLTIANEHSNPAYVASDLLSQAEHGPDSQVVLLAVGMSDQHLQRIEDEVRKQGEALPRASIVRESIPKSFILRVSTLEEAIGFSNAYAPEHLIINIPLEEAEKCLPLVSSAGSVFLGPYASESCGDYASGTNHTLPTYGYARMYSGVNTSTFTKHITAQRISPQGLLGIAPAVMALAEVEELEAHRNSVAIRVADLQAGK